MLNWFNHKFYIHFRIFIYFFFLVYNNVCLLHKLIKRDYLSWCQSSQNKIKMYSHITGHIDDIVENNKLTTRKLVIDDKHFLTDSEWVIKAWYSCGIFFAIIYSWLIRNELVIEKDYVKNIWCLCHINLNVNNLW